MDMSTAHGPLDGSFGDSIGKKPGVDLVAAGPCVNQFYVSLSSQLRPQGILILYSISKNDAKTLNADLAPSLTYSLVGQASNGLNTFPYTLCKERYMLILQKEPAPKKPSASHVNAVCEEIVCEKASSTIPVKIDSTYWNMRGLELYLSATGDETREDETLWTWAPSESRRVSDAHRGGRLLTWKGTMEALVGDSHWKSSGVTRRGAEMIR